MTELALGEQTIECQLATSPSTLTRNTPSLSSEQCVPPPESLQGPYHSSICSSLWRGTRSHNYTEPEPAPPTKTTQTQTDSYTKNTQQSTTENLTGDTAETNERHLN